MGRINNHSVVGHVAKIVKDDEMSCSVRLIHVVIDVENTTKDFFLARVNSAFNRLLTEENFDIVWNNIHEGDYVDFYETGFGPMILPEMAAAA